MSAEFEAVIQYYYLFVRNVEKFKKLKTNPG